eukprot:1376987-Pleurochrysis_carterae.AAC.1
MTYLSERVISTFNKSEAGPSSSTFHRAARASNEEIVYVTAEDKPLRRGIVAQGENARIRGGL